MVWEVVVGAVLLGCSIAGANYPQFDANTQMRNLLLPADARVGSVIYRLRGTDSDRDYPLHFAATDYGSYVVRLDNLPCNKTSPACEANVYLERSVSPGQVFNFRLTVRDTAGDTTTSAATVKVTDGSTDFQNVFPHVPGVIMIPEDARVGTELDYVIVKKHPRSLRPAKLELVGANEFTIRQTSKKDTTTGVITLSLPLDYEVQTMYKLSVFAMGMLTETAKDTRNIAGFELVVVVTDVQDTPPTWDAIAPITYLSPNLTKGDMVMKVTARDGDRGAPRDIRYALAAEKNPFTVFFDINEATGEIRLVRELKELTSISRSHQPILLTVIAEEVGSDGKPEDSSTATVALLLGELGNTPPYFESTSYVTHLAENSPQGTALNFGDPYITTVRDNDMGKHGVFSLSLENNNGTFEISPTVGEREADFIIRVRNNELLDYEIRREVSFEIWAKELSPVEKPLSTSVNVTVYITDLNDNPPVFVSSNYTAEVPENVTAGYRLVKVEATDVDSGDGGVVKYTAIFGAKNNSLSLHPDTGILTVATDTHGFDREESSMYQFHIEARDNKGNGNKATVPFTLYILDVNDNVPRFLRNPMDFILGPEGLNFSQQAFIKAVDNDAEPPNNVVRYEILSGNYGNRFLLDSITGELRVNPTAGRVTRQTTTLVATLLVRAYDMGVPSLWTTGEVRVFPAENQARTMRFLLPGRDLDPKKVEAMLSQVSGASRVIIHNIQPYNGQTLPGDSTDLSSGPGGDKSIVTATILYNNNALVDLDDLQKKFATNKNISSIIINERVVTNAVERSDTTVIFWILLILLLLLLLALLILLLCCLCPWCPLYSFFNSILRRKSWLQESTVVITGATAEKEKLPETENKSVQAEWTNARARREAWSADDRRGWAFNGFMGSPRQLFLLPSRSRYQREQHQQQDIQDHQQHQQQQQPPHVIFTREVSNRPHLLQSSVASMAVPEKPRPSRQEALLLEDIEGTEYQVLDAARLREAPTRQSMFIRDGGAEILRLVTRGRNPDEEEPQLNQPQRPFTLEHRETEGKASIMKRFINDTNGHRSTLTPSKGPGTSRLTENERQMKSEGGEDIASIEEGKRNELMKRVMDLDVDRDISTADVNRLTTIQRDLLLTRFLVEEQRRTKVDDTQSLPGVVTMATQTDKHAETQTDKIYFKRRSKSDNEESMSDTEDNGKKRFRRRRVREDGTVEFRPGSRCEIKSPIIEEGEDLRANAVTQTKSSLIRQSAVRSKIDDEFNRRTISEIDLSASRKKEIVRSLQVTPVRQMNITNNILIEHVTHQEPTSQSSIEPSDSRSKSSMEPSSDSRSKSKNGKEKQAMRGRGGVRTQPGSRETSISPSKEPHYRSLSHGRTTPRYMDWYKTKKEQREKVKRDEKDIKYSSQQSKEDSSKLHPKKFNPYLRKNYGRRARRKGEESPLNDKRVVIQDNIQTEKDNKSYERDKQEDDLDSGIALPYHIGTTPMKNHPALEKKSIFTIAYDDMETKQIRIDSASTP